MDGRVRMQSLWSVCPLISMAKRLDAQLVCCAQARPEAQSEHNDGIVLGLLGQLRAKQCHDMPQSC
jgi:hypothetical protein